MRRRRLREEAEAALSRLNIESERKAQAYAKERSELLAKLTKLDGGAAALLRRR